MTDEERIRAYAQKMLVTDDLAIDDDASVSIQNEPGGGAWVAAWVWVPEWYRTVQSEELREKIERAKPAFDDGTLSALEGRLKMLTDHPGETHICEACGAIVGADYCTDEEVCGGTDAPGFFLCDRDACSEKRNALNVNERRALYAEGRRKAIEDQGQ